MTVRGVGRYGGATRGVGRYGGPAIGCPACSYTMCRAGYLSREIAISW